jgi:hypothetical protein
LGIPKNNVLHPHLLSLKVIMFVFRSLKIALEVILDILNIACMHDWGGGGAQQSCNSHMPALRTLLSFLLVEQLLPTKQATPHHQMRNLTHLLTTMLNGHRT